MLSFEVGKEFPLPPVKEEGAVFSVEPFTLMLVYRYSRPSQEEINEFKNGTFQIAVTELRHVLFVATQFGRLNWADAPYSTHFSDRDKTLPELQESHLGYALDAFLVDCADNTLAAHRLVRLTPDFSRKLRSLLLDDMAKPFDAALYDAAVADVYRSYSTKDLIKLNLIHMKTNE
ncbi:MAG: hypothetical protein J6P72_07005 [Firmicutes bacterium]|nr:hypothetical protein [Bacillota bacterium]